MQINAPDGTPLIIDAFGAQVVAAGMDMITRVAIITGKAYAWTAPSINVAVGESLLTVRNDSEIDLLIVPYALVTGGNVASVVTIHKVVTAYTDAGGAVIVAAGLGPASPAAPVSARTNESGSAQGNIIAAPILLTETTLLVPLGVVLAGGEAVSADQVTESTAGGITFYGYFLPR